MRRREFLQTSLGVAALWPARALFAGDSAQLGEIPARTLAGGATVLRGTDISDLAASMRGQVLVAGHEGYDQARRVWNGMFDRRPAVIARCASPSDVMRAVSFARDHQLLTAVRAGGHSLSGKSTCDGGIMIDVSPMQGVRVDPRARTARVDGGALLAHLDRETQQFGLVTTAGTVSHTGAAGLTLGGGFGRVGRRFGLACDNLKSVDVVTADGRLLTASAQHNADLFWGLRGGGGNFGVATSFEYALHPMDPTILGGAIAWPLAQARDVLHFYAEFAPHAPDELNCNPVLSWTPDGPMIALEVCWSADRAQGERVLRALRSLGKPAFDKIAPLSYVALQSKSDAMLAPGIRFYAKSGFVTAMSQQFIDTVLDVFQSAPPNSFSLLIQQGGGAIARTPVDAAAFPNRRASYWVLLSKGWQASGEDQQRVNAVRGSWKRIEPLTNGFYVNAVVDDEYARVAANYGANYPRLQQLKRRYDPGNQFRLNANVLPAGSS
jgi:FAD binding domain/Berberine and berberine like